jgi:hypothetical protein
MLKPSNLIKLIWKQQQYNDQYLLERGEKEVTWGFSSGLGWGFPVVFETK